MEPVLIIGDGLAGSEAAWQVARAGVLVVLHETRPVRGTHAHQGAGLAELDCSNSFRSDDAERNAVGLLHEETRRCGALVLRAADAYKVPAGGALAVDRFGFSEAVEAALAAGKSWSKSGEGLKRTAQEDGSLQALERIRAMSDQLYRLPYRHGRACPGHPRGSPGQARG